MSGGGRMLGAAGDWLLQRSGFWCWCAASPALLVVCCISRDVIRLMMRFFSQGRSPHIRGTDLFLLEP